MALTKIKGITPEKALAASNEFKRILGVREAIGYLARYNLPASAAVALFRQYGPDTVEVVSHNPYVLCGYPAYQDFGVADAIAQSMSLEYDARERVCAGLLFVLRHNLQNGHACLPQDKLCGAASGFWAWSRRLWLPRWPSCWKTTIYAPWNTGKSMGIPA